MSGDAWLLLIIHLPGRHPALRMRLWRAVKALGAGVLRDGAYLLPCSPSTEAAALSLQQQVLAERGKAVLLRLPAQPAPTEQEFRSLFDRSAEYAALRVGAERLRSTVPRTAAASARKALAALKKEFASLQAIDYFAGAAQEHVLATLLELDSLIDTRFAAGEPRAVAESVKVRRLADYQGRTWTTRAGLWVDRMACAWLIRRFIDRRAKFVWFKAGRKAPRGAVGFDFDGAEFTHAGAQVTFERLLHHFGLESDIALRRLGTIVHFLDVGGLPVPEAAPVQALLRAICDRTASDDLRLRRASEVFDALHAGFRPAEGAG